MAEVCHKVTTSTITYFIACWANVICPMQYLQDGFHLKCFIVEYIPDIECNTISFTYYVYVDDIS